MFKFLEFFRNFVFDYCSQDFNQLTLSNIRLQKHLIVLYKPLDLNPFLRRFVYITKHIFLFKGELLIGIFMAKKCPYCGSKNTDEDKENNALLCSDCGKVSKLDKGMAKGVKIPEISRRTFITILFTAGVAIIIFLNLPTVSLINAGLLSVTAILVPSLAIANFWNTLILAIYGLILLIVAYTVWKADSQIFVGVVWVLVAVGIIAFYPIASASLESAGISKFICMAKNWNNPQASTVCGLMTGEVPEAKKIGSSEVVKVSFDTRLPERLIVYGDSNYLKLKMYSIPIEVENPNDEKTIKNFYIKSIELYKSDKKTPIPNANLIADKCTYAHPCEIGPTDKIRIGLRGTEDVEDSETEDVEIRLMFSYDYSGEGQNDFIIAKTFEYWEEAFAKSEGGVKFEGPLDVVIYFSPENIIIEDMPENETTRDVYVSVALSKEKTKLSYAEIKNKIKIIRIYDSGMLDLFEAPSKCEADWGEPDMTQSAMADELVPKKQLSEKHLYVCKYTLKPEFKLIEKSKTIKFIARVDYSFVDTKIQKNIVVVRRS